MTLFNYSLEFQVLKDLMENDVEVNEETGEFIDNSKVIADLFSEISLKFDIKLNDSQRWIIEQEAAADALKAEAKRLSAKATAFQNKQVLHAFDPDDSQHFFFVFGRIR